MADLRFNARADIEAATRHLRGVERKAIPRAAANALNVVVRRVRNTAIDEVHKVRRTKKGIVKRAFGLIRAKNWLLTAIVPSRGTVVPLRDYGARKTTKGVTANIEGKRKLWPGAFKIDKYGGHVFQRTTGKRLPIKKRFGPSIPTALAKQAIRNAIQSVAARDFPAVFREKLNYQLAKLRSR